MGPGPAEARLRAWPLPPHTPTPTRREVMPRPRARPPWRCQVWRWLRHLLPPLLPPRPPDPRPWPLIITEPPAPPPSWPPPRPGPAPRQTFLSQTKNTTRLASAVSAAPAPPPLWALRGAAAQETSPLARQTEDMCPPADGTGEIRGLTAGGGEGHREGGGRRQ